MAAPDLSPYARQASAARQQFGAQSASNTFAKNRASAQGGRAKADFSRGFSRDLPKFTSGFGQRGMSGGGITSGVQQNAMQNYLGDYTRNTGQMQADQHDAMQQFDFNGARYQADLDRELADIHAQKQAMIAATAQHITAIKPYIGG